MSVFTEGETNQNTTEKTTGEQVSYLKTLVDLKGDKWTDPEVIAKGKIDADNYIEELEAKIAELSKKANQGDKIDELLTKIGQEAAKTTDAKPSLTDSGTEGVKTKLDLSEDQIQSLVEKTLTDRERNQTATQNIEQVNTQLDELYGTEAKAKVEERAKALGLSVDTLKDLAVKSPSAFFALIGAEPKEYRPQFNGSVRTESVTAQASGERTNRFYQDLRKKQPRQFYSSTVQQQMMTDRNRLGDKFYN